MSRVKINIWGNKCSPESFKCAQNLDGLLEYSRTNFTISPCSAVFASDRFYHKRFPASKSVLTEKMFYMRTVVLN